MTRISSEILDRLPPSDLQAEKRIIGSILILPDCIDRVAEIVRPGDFYSDANQKIFQTLMGMADRRERIDATLLVDRLRRDGELESAGGVAYIAECVQADATAHNAPQYASIVARNAKRRAIIHASCECLREAWDDQSEPDEVLNDAERLLAEVRTGDYQGTVMTAAEVAVEALSDLAAMEDRQRIGGVFTGLPQFDEHIGGLFPGELCLLAARTSHGKTALACQIARHNAERGRLVYFVSLEMRAAKLALRLFSAMAEVNSQSMRTGSLTDEDKAKIFAAAEKFSTTAMRFDRRPGLKLYDLRRTARSLLRDGLKVVVIDYLTKITPNDTRQPREQQVAEICRGLQELARELNVPVLCLAQLNRAAEQQEKPTLANLRESGACEQDSDMVLILNRPPNGIWEWEETESTDSRGKRKTSRQRVQRPWDAELELAKDRNGETTTLKLTWEAQYTRFACYGDPISDNPNYHKEFAGYGGNDF
jgi:replicative DNA helicase